MAEPKVSPYNFVPLEEASPARSPYPGLDRLGSDHLSGTLVCDLEVQTPLFTADHRTARRVSAGGGRDRTLFRFLRDSAGRPMVQGTSLKGMVRSVYEAATNSCLPLAAVAGISSKAGRKVGYRYAELGAHAVCQKPEKLCPACRLFGVIHGEDIHARSRVTFSDTVLAVGDLEASRLFLAELSGPKPHHHGIYGKAGSAGGPIAGRKLFYHHDPRKYGEESKRSPRANDVAEVAPRGAVFRFRVDFHNLSLQELADFRHCLELEPDLGHKLGMAKPLGFGSCSIVVLEQDSEVHQGGGRYRRLGAAALELADLDLQPGRFPAALQKLLRRDKQLGEDVGYRGWKGYAGVRLDGDGKYVRPPARAPRGPAPAAQPAPFAATSMAAAFEELRDKERAKKKPAPLRVGEKIPVEVTGKEGGELLLRVRSTGQEGLRFRGPARWRVGRAYSVRVKALAADGSVAAVQI